MSFYNCFSLHLKKASTNYIPVLLDVVKIAKNTIF